jgi:excinuclease ABC subunit A
VNRLTVLNNFALGYLRLGQPATTLSGGDAPRVRLAAHVAQAPSMETCSYATSPPPGVHFVEYCKAAGCISTAITNAAAC